jgi:1,4-alpha-glucan branching enzyme
MSLKKQVLKSKPVCKVTFRFSKDMLEGAENVNIVGDFNNWDTNSHEMKKLKTGEFTSLIELEQGRSYEFRYLVNGNEWYNDEAADRYVGNAFGAENCVVETV